MNHSDFFSEFSRQSFKGVLVIYGNLLVKIFKRIWVIFLLLINKISQIYEAEPFHIYWGLVGIFVFILLNAYFQYRNFMFKLSDGHFILRKGVLKKTSTSIAFDKIQNINFKQNLIQQLVNVYGVSIETAGTNKTEITIGALSHYKAQALKAIISPLSTSYQTDEQEKPFVKISGIELVKVSVTENHFKSLFLFLVIAGGFFQQIEQIFESFGKKEYLEEYLSQRSEAIFGSIILIILLFLCVLVISVLSSFLRVFLRHFNLLLRVKRDAFEINQGIFTKKSMVLKKQKIQSITILSNPLKKWAGISCVIFKQALSGKVNNKGDKLIKIVGCKTHQVDDIKNHLFDSSQLESSPKHYTDSYYKLKMLYVSLAVSLAGTFSLFVFSDIYGMLYLNALSMPLCYFLVDKKYKKRFYKISKDLILVGRGLIETHHTYFQLFKVQNVKMKQSVFQQRRNVVDLVLQTASGKIRIPCIPSKDAVEIFNRAVYKSVNSRQPWI